MDLAETASSPAYRSVSCFSAEFLYTTPDELSKGARAECAANGVRARKDSGLAPRMLMSRHKKYKNVNIRYQKYKIVNIN
jgi:hypothetical protein